MSANIAINDIANLIFVFRCTHVRMTYVSNSYLLTCLLTDYHEIYENISIVHVRVLFVIMTFST